MSWGPARKRFQIDLEPLLPAAYEEVSNNLEDNFTWKESLDAERPFESFFPSKKNRSGRPEVWILHS